MPERAHLDPELSFHAWLAVNRIPSMLAYWDRNGVCRFANAAYLKWFGVPPEAVVGRPIQDLLGPTLYAKNEPHVLAVLQGVEQTFERVVPGADGVQRHALACYVPHVADGEVRGFVAHVTEITKLKETEAALRHEQALRQRIEQHAAELKALLDERSEMLQVLAHEVRQPLNNASAALQSAATTLAAGGEQVASHSLARARAVLGQVLARIDNTLAEASLLSGHEPITQHDTDIDTLLAMVVADMPAGERARIAVDRQSAARTASMDTGLMRLALRNLLANALRHGPADTPVVLRVQDSDEPLGLLFEVEDHGPGIPADVRPRVFERGVRGGSAPGHGLGLYITRRVMELHGGTAGVARSDATGTCMRLTLPQSGG
ncbi:ATP-binding protein [Ideonella sp.]|uniref:sensor histidine kinase n=1 Tax=Ideonella sp. TaxID=1929293 RepID=UPI0035B0ABC5